jgi:hypothetical protein
MKAVFPDEAGECGQLEFDQRDEELDREDEEGEQHQRPGEEQAGDLDEVFEEGDPAHQIRDGFEQWPRRIEARLRNPARAHQVLNGKPGA